MILMALADYANDDGEAWPKQATLAMWTCLERTTIIRGLRELEEQGFIKATQQHRDDGGFRSKKYRLLFVGTPVADFNRGGGSVQQGGVAGCNSKNSHKERSEEQPLMSPAATAAEEGTSSSKEKITDKLVEVIVAIYNEHCDVLPSAQSINAKRARSVRKMIREHGFDEAKDLMRRATLAVASDDFWRSSRKYGFDNLLAGDKYVQKAEAWTADKGSTAHTDVAIGSTIEFSHRVGMRDVRVFGSVVSSDGNQVEAVVSDDQAVMPGTYRVPLTHIKSVKHG